MQTDDWWSGWCLVVVLGRRLCASKQLRKPTAVGGMLFFWGLQNGGIPWKIAGPDTMKLCHWTSGWLLNWTTEASKGSRDTGWRYPGCNWPTQGRMDSGKKILQQIIVSHNKPIFQSSSRKFKSFLYAMADKTVTKNKKSAVLFDLAGTSVILHRCLCWKVS